MHPIDLRSDAITRPTNAMWEAMQQAQLGWALVHEDASVNELEAYTARLAGKEAALFVPTGSMANLIALMSHTQRGDQVVMEASSHTLWSEEWGFAYVCGLAPRAITGVQGYMEPSQIETAILDQRFSHRPVTRLLCLENTHNTAGGTVLTGRQTAAMAEAARKHGVAVHLDGMRIFNACAALDQPLQTLVEPVDTVTVGLNKGLSAPGGALLCGSTDFIAQSRINLKRLGGQSLHQAGILAAAGLVALKTMRPQLHQDHRRAQQLAHGLAPIPGLHVDLQSVQTNIVMATVDSALMAADEFVGRLARQNIRVSGYSTQTVRFVTHRHITEADIEQVIHTARTIFSGQ